MKKILLLFFLVLVQAMAEVKLPAVMSDNMVLQRSIEIPIWGWANPGEKISVSFAGKTVSTEADKDGNWLVKLAKHEASKEGREIEISGTNKIVLKNILVGDVWICSGQSNMEFALKSTGKEAKSDAEAQQKNKNLRLFRIPDHVKSATPKNNTKGTWTTTENIENSLIFSGVGFYFGVKLQNELDVPIGLIDTSWGGTPVDQWISNDAYSKYLKSARKDSIYNGMVAPLVPYAIKGVIWYQGESNRGNAYPSYLTKLQALIEGWRKEFQVEDCPFYLVQIAPYNYTKPKNLPSSILCDNIWAAQYKAAKEIKNCGIVPIHDTIQGNINDIHPKDKKPVGERLAALALKKDYGKDVPYTGPEFSSAKVDGASVVVSFSNIDKGLMTKDGKDLTTFEIAGEDKVFVAAKAVIKGDTVVVSAENVKAPKFVRMGWDEIYIPNLADKNGWPAFQFAPQEVK